MKDRLYQFVLIASTIGCCWLGMQIVHELGHVLAAYICGETVKKVVLHPMVISRTDVSHDRFPLLVIWAGPILGSLLPLIFLSVARLLHFRLIYLFQFFAGFCLVANGVYLGAGSFNGVGDAGDLFHCGVPKWMLIIFALVCASAGLRLWNRLGIHFGLGESKGKVDRKAVQWVSVVLLIIVLAEIVLDSR